VSLHHNKVNKSSMIQNDTRQSENQNSKARNVIYKLMEKSNVSNRILEKSYRILTFYTFHVIFKTLTTIYKQVIITHSKINKTAIILSNTTINYKLQKDKN